jgi:hypothetical protein
MGVGGPTFLCLVVAGRRQGDVWAWQPHPELDVSCFGNYLRNYRVGFIWASGSAELGLTAPNSKRPRCPRTLSIDKGGM